MSKRKKLLLLFRNDNTYMHLICFWGMPNIKIRRSVFIWTAKLTGIPGWLLETSFKMVVEFFKCFMVGRTIFTIMIIYMMFNDMHSLKTLFEKQNINQKIPKQKKKNKNNNYQLWLTIKRGPWTTMTHELAWWHNSMSDLAMFLHASIFCYCGRIRKYVAIENH